jgi:uncharacterized Zn finger protein (UPF0148 family)
MAEETKSKKAEEETQGAPVCEKCGSILIEEIGEMVCPDCDGEIDFFGDDDEEEETNKD